MNYTPGPWSYANSYWEETQTNLTEDMPFILCGKREISEDENWANAALMAAAPDMYEALKGVLDAFGDPAEGKLLGIRAVLAKAEGRR